MVIACCCLFFIFRSASSTSHDVIAGTSFGSVWIMVLCSLSYTYLGVEFLYSCYDHILIMDFSTLLGHEYDQSVLAQLLRSSDFLQAL